MTDLLFSFKKTIDFDLTEAANVLDIPVISDFLRLTISDIFNKFLVLPNRYVIPIVPDFNLSDAAELKAPNPKVSSFCTFCLMKPNSLFYFLNFFLNNLNQSRVF
jgi:hypothetical protein